MEILPHPHAAWNDTVAGITLTMMTTRRFGIGNVKAGVRSEARIM